MHDLFGYIAKIRAVNTTTHADDTVILLALLSTLTDCLCNCLKLFPPFLIRFPGRQDMLIEVVAKITDAGFVKDNGWICRVHDTVGANL